MALRKLGSPELDAAYLEFISEHPELEEKLALWMASRSTWEALHPEESKLFLEKLPELAG